MGKKKGAKKGGDDFFEDGVPELDEVVSSPSSERKSAFAALSLDDAPATADVPSDEEGGGGLMAQMSKAQANANAGKGKKQKKKKQEVEDVWDELGEDVSGNATEAPKAPEVADAADEFPDPAEEKKKKKGKKEKAQPEDEEMEDGENAEPEDGAGEVKILSKKEKEKLKKEKEKAKKKAQAAAKKAAAGGDAKNGDDEAAAAALAAPEEPKATPAAPAEKEEDDEEEEGGAGGADKKKKKKKKKAADKEPAPAAASGKKPSAAIAALQARLAAQKKAEEEARLAEEEARRAEQEAERLEAEEEARKEAERARKKEKERAKREQLKKEGKLLTPKQKAEKAAAEARMQAMIRSGQVKVEALERKDGDGGAPPEKRKVVDSRKKRGKGPGGPPNKLAPKGPLEPVAPAEEEEAEPVKEPEPEPTPEPEAAAPAEEEDDDVLDSWDAESEDEKEEPAKAPEPAAKAAEPAAKAPAKAKEAAKPAAAAKKAAESESESESEDDSDDSSDESDSDDSSSEEEMTAAQKQAAQRKAEQIARLKAKKEAAQAEVNKDDLRSPICCILGHVDTGKTKLLDKIRQTNVQGGEAGGITQQIGATYFPVDVLKEKIAPIDPEGKQVFKTPGLLVIDTPGHESFTNLRTRGSSLCNIAVLVVDIMHGLEQQTLESIRLLRDKKTPFIVALNKIDRLYGWQATPNGGFRDSLAKQNKSTQNEFDTRLQSTIVAFAEQGLNAVPYYNNKNFARNVSLVPTSAHTGEGIPDMLQLLVQLTQERMAASLMYLSELECTVLEVKVIEGLGTTIDVILSNGVLREGDKIVLCGLNGPIVTNVRALLTPEPLKEMRVKGAYVHHKLVKAALGVKISAPGLEKAISGSRLLVCTDDDDEEELKDDVMSDLKDLQRWISTSGKGVCVQASTLGSLEALLEFLKQGKIPVSGIDIGPVFKSSVRRASTMLDKGHTEYACLLCFDVEIDKEAEKLAGEMGVQIFSKMTIYNLVDDYRAFYDNLMEARIKDAAPTAVWPCRLKTLAVFAKREPIILGCEILDGDLRIGTPLCVVKVHPETKKREVVSLGRVTSLEINHKPKDIVTRKEQGAGVAVRIECAVYEQSKVYGRHFEEKDEIYSMISRTSIDTLKEHFWDKVSTDQKKLIKALKPLFNIP